MTKIIAFANQKGGVAKTTSAIALAQTLAMEGKRILFLDLDPQENASNTLRVNHMPTLYDLMKARKPDDETLKKSFCQLEDNKNITAIRGDIRLASADMEFVFTGREFIIRDILRRCCDPYDVVIMDTPPNLGILTVNALSAAHTVVIPVSPDGYSLQGFMQLMASVQAVREFNNRELKIGGILITRYAPQTNIGKQIRVIASELAEAANTKVYQTAIRQTVAVSESISAQQGIVLYSPTSTAAQDYRSFMREIKREECTCCKCRDCMMKKNIRQDVRTLCPKCAALYEDSGYKLKQVNPEQSYERCMICNKPKGKDYVVSQT